MTITDRFPLKSHGGYVLVVHERAKRGDVLVSGERSWPIVGVETYCIHNPPLPWGYLIEGEDPPNVGDEVTIEKGPAHDSTPWPREPEAVYSPAAATKTGPSV